MEDYIVEDLMVPLAEYATVSSGCTLHEAVLALEKAQEEFDLTKYKHRSVLVLDKHEHVIGRLNHLDALRALIPSQQEHWGIEDPSRFGFSNHFIRKLHHQRLQQTISLEQLCNNARKFKVEEYMRTPSEDEFILHTANIATAIHQLVQENLRSLLVKKGARIIGILRLTDIFSAFYHTIARPERP